LAFPGVSPDTALLLTDGSVVMHDICTGNWFRLIPNTSGSYINGSWSAFAPGDKKSIAAMPSGHAPLFYASAVLPDGRLIVNGGEYNTSACTSADTNLGALYNPFTNTWSTVPAPPGFSNIGDASSIVLGPNTITGGYSAGSYMLGNCGGPVGFSCGGGATFTKQAAVATIAPIPGTTVTWTITAAGKVDQNSEEGWILLPNGWLLTVDTNNPISGPNPTTEIFEPGTNKWTASGNTPVFLGNTLGMSIVPEMGPGVSIGLGVAVQIGATSNTAVFTLAGTWTAGPTIGMGYEVADGPGALLPNGNILVQTSVGFNPPSLFWELGSSTLTPANAATTAGTLALIQVANPPCGGPTAGATNIAAFQGRLLVLPASSDAPNGQVLWSGGEADGNNNTANCTSIYVPNAGDGLSNATMRPAPHISSVSNSTMFRGNTYSLTGSMLRGVSQGATYGDDAQMATNYPLVRITNNTSGQVCYGRTHDWAILTSTQFDIPPATTPAANWALLENPCDTAGGGASTLVVITNGMVSNPITVTIQ
jgi:hypothetical protein